MSAQEKAERTVRGKHQDPEARRAAVRSALGSVNVPDGTQAEVD